MAYKNREQSHGKDRTNDTPNNLDKKKTLSNHMKNKQIKTNSHFLWCEIRRGAMNTSQRDVIGLLLIQMRSSNSLSLYADASFWFLGPSRVLDGAESNSKYAKLTRMMGSTEEKELLTVPPGPDIKAQSCWFRILLEINCRLSQSL